MRIPSASSWSILMMKRVSTTVQAVYHTQIQLTSVTSHMKLDRRWSFKRTQLAI